jgi:hypothetical protein
MHTRSAKNKTTGLFAVLCWDWNGAEFFRGQFASVQEADHAAADAERRMTLAMQRPASAPLSLDEILMSDDELLAALTA